MTISPDDWVAFAAASVLAISAIAAARIACRAQDKPKPASPALKAAVDEHWKPTAKGRVWRGADFVRPSKADEK